MSVFLRRNKIKEEILNTERLLESVSDHPFMSIGLKEKIESLNAELSQMPEVLREPKLRMLFSGNAVFGSIGIKSSFLGKTVKPVQELIKTQTALIKYGGVGGRGRTKKSSYSELFITALPTGSFGVELTQLAAEELFQIDEVSEAIQQVVDLVEATSGDNEVFESILEFTPKRSLANLKSFFKTIHEANSILKIETNTTELSLTESEIRDAFERVNSTENEENETVIEGVLRGILLDSGKFEMTSSESGELISGIINPDIPEETRFEYDRKFLNKTCQVLLQVNRTIFVSGKEKTSYELIEILELKE